MSHGRIMMTVKTFLTWCSFCSTLSLTWQIGLQSSPSFKTIIPSHYKIFAFDLLIKQIWNTTEFYGTTIWQSSQTNNFVIRQFSERLPTIQMSLGHSFCSLSVLKFPRSSINLMLLKETSLDSLKRKFEAVLFESITNCSIADSTLPRTMVIIFEADKNLDSTIKLLLREAWKWKFADLTVVIIPKNPKSRSRIWRYEMFEKKFFSKIWKINVELFPDKLNDMKGQPIIMGFNKKKYNSFSIQKEITQFYNPFIQAEISAGTFGFLKRYFCELHNCTPSLEASTSFDSVDLHYKSHLMTKAGRYNEYSYALCSRLRYTTAAIPHLEKHLIGFHFYYDNCKTVIMFFAALFLILKLFIKTFRLSNREFSWTNVLFCVLGRNMPNRIFNTKSRMFYLTLICVAFYLSNCMLDETTDYELTIQVKTIDSMEDLLKMKKRIFLTNKTKSCIKKLIKNNDRICFGMMGKIEVEAAACKTKFKKGLRRANFKVASHCYSARFAPNSPYVEKFNKLTQRSFDVGLLKRRWVKDLIHWQGFEEDPKDIYDKVFPSESDLFKSYLIVLSSVHVLAIAVFLLELLINSCFKRPIKPKKIVKLFTRKFRDLFDFFKSSVLILFQMIKRNVLELFNERLNFII